MDSMKTPGKLQELSLEFTWTPDGIHKDAWLSVTISLNWSWSSSYLASKYAVNIASFFCHTVIDAFISICYSIRSVY